MIFGCVGGGPAGVSGQRQGGRANALSGLPGPAGRGRRSHFEFRYRQSWAADAGARLHLDFLCDGGAGHEGCSEETARHIWFTRGCLAFPSLSPATSAQKICPRAAVCCPLRGKSFAHRHASAHCSVSPRMCPSASPGCVQAMEHAWHAKRLPRARSGGFPPPDFVPTRREDSSLVISTSTGRAKPDAFTMAKMQGKAPTRRPQIVERIAVEPQNCAEH